MPIWRSSWPTYGSNDLSKAQVKKLQGFFFQMREKFGLPDPHSKNYEERFFWVGYNKTLAAIHKKPEWKKPQTHKVSLDGEQDNEVVSELSSRIMESMEVTVPAQLFDFIALRSLVSYMILTDTASRPQFIDNLHSKDVKIMNKGDYHNSSRVMSRTLWMHTTTSKNYRAEDKYIRCCCPEREENYHDEEEELGSPCSTFECCFNIVVMYRDMIPNPNSEVKFMRNYKRKAKKEVGFLEKNGGMGYNQVRATFKWIGDDVLTLPLHLTPGCGRTTGITLMSRMGLSDEAICAVSGHLCPKTMRKNYLIAGIEEKSLGSVELQNSRLREENRLLEFSSSDPVLQLPAPSIAPVSIAAPLQLLMDAALVEGSRGSPISIDMEEQVSPPVIPTPKRGRPNFKLRSPLARRRAKELIPAKENVPDEPEEYFPLSQPLPVAHQKVNGDQRRFGGHLSVFNQAHPPFGAYPMGMPAMPHLEPRKTQVFKNCNFAGATINFGNN